MADTFKEVDYEPSSEKCADNLSCVNRFMADCLGANAVGSIFARLLQVWLLEQSPFGHVAVELRSQRQLARGGRTRHTQSRRQRSAARAGELVAPAGGAGDAGDRSALADGNDGLNASASSHVRGQRD